MKQRIVIGLVLFLTFSNNVFSQQLPISSGYMFNIFQINPAYAGFKDAIQINSMFRKQLTDYKNSPQSAYFGVDLPILNKRVGLGLQFVDERQAIFKTTGAQLSYSYKIPIGENASLSMGLQAGLFDYSIDYTRVEVIDPNDPMFSQEISNKKLNFGTGFFYGTPQFYMGLSSPNFIRNNLIDAGIVNANNITQNIQVNLNSGYAFMLSDNLYFTPSMLVRGVQGKPVSFDVNARLSVADKLSIGVSYREKSVIASMINIKILPDVHIGYAYDYNTTQFNTISKGFHEVMLRYEIPSSRQNQSPTNIFNY